MDQPPIEADRDAWLVYADTLQEKGDPLGELIALNDRVDTGDAAAVVARDQHLNDHADAILGAEAASRRKRFELSWHFGYVSRARVSIQDDDDPAAITTALLRCPAVTHLEEIDLVGVPATDDSHIDLRPAVAALVERLPKSCWTVRLADERAATRTALTSILPQPEPNLVSFGRLQTLYALPQLRHLEITCADPDQEDLENIVAPNLRTIALRPLRFTLVPWIPREDWPLLESFELRVPESFMTSVAYDPFAYRSVYPSPRSDDYPNDVERNWDEVDWEAQLSPLLYSLMSCPLRRLALTAFYRTDSMLALLHHALIPTLEELDLSGGRFESKHVEWFLRNAHRLVGLKRIRLERTAFSADDLERLRSIGPEIIHTPGGPGPSHRYVVGRE